MAKAFVLCKTCNRVIWATDADTDGNCSEHPVASKMKESKSESKDKDK